MKIRPYQYECIQTTIDEFQKGIRRQAVSLPVGSGKTVIFANLIKSLPDGPNGARKCLVLAHREELLIQARNQISRFAPHLSVTIEQGGLKGNPNADVVIASVPTLGRSGTGTTRLEKFDPSQFKCIIIDEAHHSVTDTYIRIMNHFGVLDGRNPHILVWGCSATLSRFDELALNNLFEKVTFHLDMQTMIKEGWLAPFQMYQIVTSVNLESVKRRNHEFDTTSLSLAINTPVRNDLIAGTWKAVAREQHNRKATIVFALNIAHVNGLLEAFKKIGVHAAAVTSLTEDDERESILNNFRSGNVEVLVNCAVLTEGTDLPITDCILMTRPTCNANLYVQMIGRGLRMHPEKDYCLILDVIDRERTGERTLVTLPSLLAYRTASNDIDVEVVGVDEPRPKHAQKEIATEGINVEIKAFNPTEYQPSTTLSWVKVDPGKFILSSKSTLFVMNVTSSLTCTIEEYVSLDSGAISVEPVLEEMSVKEAMPRFYEYLREVKKYSEFACGAPWRMRSPPSPMQMKMLGQIMKRLSPADSSSIPGIYKWTIGKASNVISKYIFKTKILKRPPMSWEELVDGIKNY